MVYNVIRTRKESCGSVSFFDLLSVTGTRPIESETPLTETDRGFVRVVLDNKTQRRCVIRFSLAPNIDRIVTNDNSKLSIETLASSGSTALRVLLFGAYVADKKKEFSGIVPAIQSPFVLPDLGFVVEKYEEVKMASIDERMDFHNFIVRSRSTQWRSDTTVSYLRDVCGALRDMHAHNFVHLDVSLENVCLTDDRAFLIDFESVLPSTPSTFVHRKILQVPLKMTYVPPEHILGHGDDFVSLQGYDVWAFGIMVFSAIFKQSLFSFKVGEQGVRMPCFEEVLYFSKHGFIPFMNKYQPEIARLLFQMEHTHNASWWANLVDLLQNILVPAKVMCDQTQKRIWLVRRRLTMEQIFHHPFFHREV